MKDPQKFSTFSTQEYIRPNQDWVCGHLCKGEACRIGPTQNGKCRATYECVPLLKVKPGETKGHWTCTRPGSAGGKCDKGPLPDGTCCNAIPKCQPRRTLRNIRKRVTAFTIIASILVLFIGIDRSMRDDFINPGPISDVHSSEQFSKLTFVNTGDSSNCASCHESARGNAELWHSKVADAFMGGLAPHELLKKGPALAAEMDNNCLECHAEKDFHQPNMPAEFACHACHQEHQGGGFMPEVSSQYCTACHASGDLMGKARELARGVNPHAFPASNRPEKGYTQLIRAFDDGHPEFRLIRDKVRDGNSLKFNHKIHLGSDLTGGPLSCKDCHESDAKGEYQLPITYTKNCSSCHALQFDKETPDLTLPHGDPFYVRSFLRSLSIQYEEHARTEKSITLREPLKNYVDEKRAGVEATYQTGEYLERAVFFANMKGEVPGGRRAPFAGCATCHEVSEPINDNGAPLITGVSAPGRWMQVGKFNHDAHQKGMSCIDCHDVLNSELTSDVNLPSIKSCIECHSPKGGIDHRCIHCHTYHNSK